MSREGALEKTEQEEFRESHKGLDEFIKKLEINRKDVKDAKSKSHLDFKE